MPTGDMVNAGPDRIPGFVSAMGGVPLIPVTTVDGALKVSVVWRCVQLIADALAAAPLEVFRQSGATKVKLATPKVFSTPQADLSSHDWQFAFTAAVLLTGNGYALKADLDPMGWPRQLVLLDPTTTKPLVDREAGTLTGYKSGQTIYPPDRVLHVRAFTFPGRAEGLSPLAQFGQTIGLGALAERFGYSFFQDSAIPTAIIYSDEELDEPTAQKIKGNILKAWRGKREPAVLGAGLKYQQVSVNPDESQFLQTQAFSVEQICRIFGMPPELVGHAMSGSSVTYANLEQRQLGFQTWTLMPWAARFETAYTACLPQPQFARFNLDSLVRVDMLTRYTAHGKKLRDGWGRANEVRRDEGLGPIPNGDLALWPLIPPQGDAKPEGPDGTSPAPPSPDGTTPPQPGGMT